MNESTTSASEATVPGEARLGFIVCGALAREVHQIAHRRGWPVDIHGVPAEHHLCPDRIVQAVEARLVELESRYDRLVVVYGDCGTAGALDRLLARHRAVRPAGPHCYAMLAGCSTDRLSEQVPETYFLTDYLVRRWEQTVLRGLGLDRRPELKELCFRGFKRLIFLRQDPAANLLEKARQIADFMELPLEVWDVGLAGLEARLAEIVEDEASSPGEEALHAPG